MDPIIEPILETTFEIDNFMDQLENDLFAQFDKELKENLKQENEENAYRYQKEMEEFLALEDLENQSKEDIEFMKYFNPDETENHKADSSDLPDIVNSNGKSYVVMKTIEAANNGKTSGMMEIDDNTKEEQSLQHQPQNWHEQNETPKTSCSPKPRKPTRRALFNEKDGCEMCFPEVFYTRQRKVNRSQKYFMCELCGTAFQTKQRIQQHEKQKHKKGGIPCLVEDCYKKFATRRARDDHIITEPHTNHTCACGKIFKKKYNLKKHAKHCN